MAFDSVPGPVQTFEARVINNIIEKLHIFVFPHKFDMQMQLSLAIQEERLKMDYWREAHGLPNFPPAHGHLPATPPMPLPFIDHHVSTLDNNNNNHLSTSFGEGDVHFSGVPHWVSGSSSSSPFRQATDHAMTGGTVSPRELSSSSSHNTHPMVPSGPYHDDMSMFTFSDSENSLPSLPEPPMSSSSSTHRRKTGLRSEMLSRASQNYTNSQSRHPLPAGPREAVSRNHVRGSGTYDTPFVTGFGQQSYPITGQEDPSHQRDLALRSSDPAATHGSKPSRSSRRHATPSVPAHAAALSGPLHMLAPAPAPAPTTPVSTFPPGQDMPGFVPIGRVGIANAAQGNKWPIDRELFEQLVGAERGHGGGGGGEHRPKTKLTYKEILAKYSRWDIKESTLRGIKRKITLPKEHRERKPRWNEEHIHSLCRHVPVYTDKKGKVSWTKVVDAIKRDTGRPFGAGTTSKKWADLHQTKTKTKRSSAVDDHQSQSGGEEERDIDDHESSPSIFDIGDVSEEDLPSHKFSFQRDEEDDDDADFGGAGGFAPINSPAARLQCPRMLY